MDFKAVISNCGDEKLYKTLSSEIERRLPSSAVEWKRSYGRPSKQVVLQANFIKFDSSQLAAKIESASSLGSKPLLHIFWTGCLDNDSYKSKVRNQLLRWHRQLQDTSTPDWLIVHVVYQDNAKGGKPKIQLPRMSVYDKIKTEFGQKQQDRSFAVKVINRMCQLFNESKFKLKLRCLQLWEPDKETLFTKSGESWQILLLQLRNLLLESFGQQLDSFEDRIRVMREKYANHDWPFLSYFTVHEELALIYESIMLKEDSLVQYDEVDALISQFIINSSARGLPNWLEKFRSLPFKWSGVILKKTAIEYYRAIIIKEDVSLIEFRNYLFARQCKLLIKNKRKWEIPSRLLEFLHTVVQELRILKIETPKGTIACWVILTCLHFFDVLESYESKDHSFNSTMAQICDYLRNKIRYLGEITGLLYPREQTEDEIKLCKTLADGFGELDQSSKKDKNIISPSKRLKAVLQSKTEFRQMYLEISCKCLNMLSDVKRTHTSIFAGIDLAKFYLLHGQYTNAEPLLERAWSIYKQQKWQLLYTDILIPLADCQLQHELYDRYLYSVTMLASATCLSLQTREYYSNEFLRTSNNEKLKLAPMETEPVLTIQEVVIDLVKNKGHIGDTVRVTAKITNNLTENLYFKQIAILCRHCDLNNPRCFSDNPVSPRRSIFDQTDYGMNVTLSPVEKPKEVITKEPLTPSNLLKRFKSHRRTWSRNKNIVEENKESDSSSASLSEATPKNISPSESSQSINNETTKRALFSVGDTSISNGDINKTVGEEKSLVHLSRSQSEPASMQKAEEMLSKELNGDLRRSSKVIMASDLPIATSSVSRRSEMTEEEERQDSSVNSPNKESTVEESSIFTPSKEEVNLDKILTSEPDIKLDPGLNHVDLSAKIIHEGRYVLQCIDCIATNIKLYNPLTLPHDSKSFFMVADPPKVTWTTDYVIDYLLSGSKQRLHVTLLNGPGVIMDGSILEISSKSNLKFCELLDSSIQVFPLQRDSKSREAAISVDIEDNGDVAKLKLPSCKPYERVNLYFDVVAPIRKKDGERSMCQHDIRTGYCVSQEKSCHLEEADVKIKIQKMNFSCNWLNELVDAPSRLDCIFYEPFQVTFETIPNAGRIFIKVILSGLNPVSLLFLSPRLSAAESDYSFIALSKDTDIHLFGNEKYTLLYQMQPKDDVSESVVPCTFSVGFSTKNCDESDYGNFTQDFEVTTHKHLYTVHVGIVDSDVYCSKSCRVAISIHRNFLNADEDCSNLFLMLDPEHSSQWRYVGNQPYTRVQFEDGSYDVKLEIVVATEKDGRVEMPPFKLVKSHDMIMNFDQDNILELLTQFAAGVVLYSSLFHTVDVKKPSITSSDV